MGRALRAPLLKRALQRVNLVSPCYAGPEDVEFGGVGWRVLTRTRWLLGAEGWSFTPAGLHSFDRLKPVWAWTGPTSAAPYVEVTWRDAVSALRFAAGRRTPLPPLLAPLGWESNFFGVFNRVYLYEVDPLNRQLIFYDTWEGLIGAEQALKVWGVWEAGAYPPGHHPLANWGCRG